MFYPLYPPNFKFFGQLTRAFLRTLYSYKVTVRIVRSISTSYANDKNNIKNS